MDRVERVTKGNMNSGGSRFKKLYKSFGSISETNSKQFEESYVESREGSTKKLLPSITPDFRKNRMKFTKKKN